MDETNEGSVFIGEFEVDPSTIPLPPSVPLGRELLWEVAAAARQESNKNPST